MIENKDVQRIFNIKKQRYTEIIRDGVRVKFKIGRNLWHHAIIFQMHDYSKVFEMFKPINDKYKLQLCFENGDVCCDLNRQIVYFDAQYPDFIFINDRRIQHDLQQGIVYYLVKSNITLMILQKVYDKLGGVSKQIKSFVSQPQVKEIQSNPVQADQSEIEDLNQSQKLAVTKVLYYPVTFIKGPPGCGKTKTIARICRIFSRLGKKVIVGAVSNTAIKNIAQKLSADLQGSQSMPNITLFLMRESQQQNSHHPEQIRKLTVRQKIIQKSLQISFNPNIDKGYMNYHLDIYWKSSSYDPPRAFYTIYMQALKKVIQQTDVMISTTIRASIFKDKFPSQFSPYIGIIDEAAQTSWADSLCFLIHGIQKVVFVGDQKQLTPTVISQNQNLKQTMFTTLMNKNPQYFTLLNTQYRMHPWISHFPNQQFYEGKLENGVTEENRKSQVQYFKKYPISFINHQSQQIQSQDYILVDQKLKYGRRKLSNPVEIKIIGIILSQFPKQLLKTVGIITPYEQQLQQIIKQYESDIKQWGLSARTCDGYQGAQKQYIIVSCVRSNKQSNLGFCKQENRLNVTLTRARKGLVLIGDANNFLYSGCQAWSNYIQYLHYCKLLITEQDLYDFVIGMKKEANNSNQIKY